MALDEESKAVQEVAKTAGKAVDAAREAGGFIAKFVAGPLEQGMGIFEDRLRYMRWERQVRLMRRAEELLAQLGMSAPSRSVPLNIAIPLIQAGSLEEDDAMQDRWAALLVNAADASFPAEIQRAYVSILEQITPLEARILDTIYALFFDETQHAGVLTENLPDMARVKNDNETEFVMPSEVVVLALSNLVRVGCLRAGMTWGGGESYSRVNPTVLGRAFVHACQRREA